MAPWQSKIKDCEMKCDTHALIGKLFVVLQINGTTPGRGQSKAKYNKHEYREQILK